MDLARIIAGMRRSGAEFEDVEVKRAAGGVPETLPSTMSAFANARGGIIILGLDERQGFAASGVADPPTVRDAVAGIARGSLTPPLAPSIDIVTFEGAQLVIAEIEALAPDQRPCYVTSRGLYRPRRRGRPDGSARHPAPGHRDQRTARRPRTPSIRLGTATLTDPDDRGVHQDGERARA